MKRGVTQEAAARGFSPISGSLPGPGALAGGRRTVRQSRRAGMTRKDVLPPGPALP